MRSRFMHAKQYLGKPLSAFAIRKLLRTSSNTSRESKSYSEKGSRVTESHKDVVDFPFESLDSSRTTKRRKFRTSSENVIEGRNAEKSLNSGCNNGTAHKAIVPRTPNGDRRRSNPLIGLHRSRFAPQTCRFLWFPPNI